MFVETMTYFGQVSLMNKKVCKKQVFHNNFTVPFEQFNMFFLNKMIIS